MLIDGLRSDNCLRLTSKHMYGDSRLWISGYANCFEIPISSLKEIQVHTQKYIVIFPLTTQISKITKT